ncbi:hypothetical protein [Paenibacillus paridis]|nr:hypothetical protein [Paenibacillus paridis]
MSIKKRVAIVAHYDDWLLFITQLEEFKGARRFPEDLDKND